MQTLNSSYWKVKGQKECEHVVCAEPFSENVFIPLEHDTQYVKRPQPLTNCL